MKFLLVGPFGIYALFRVSLPLFWCLDFLYTHGLNHDASELVLMHAFYLIFQGGLFFLLMVYIVNLANRNRAKRRFEHYIEFHNKNAARHAQFALAGILLFFVLNYQDLPLFSNGGSDAIMHLGEEQKVKTWFMYGLLGALSYILMFAIVYMKSKKQRYAWGVVLVIASIVTAKKAAIIGVFGKFILLYFILAAIKPRMPVVKVAAILIVSVLFIVYQFSRTAGFDYDFSDILQIFVSLVYSSATIYLVQLIDLDGVSYAAQYSERLGSYGTLSYIFNPFLKLLFGTGIYKAPGPYLGEMLFNSNSANGANLTLFFEYIFIFGGHYFALLAILHMLVMFFLAKFFIRKIIISTHTNILVTTTYFSLFMACFMFLFDSLNTWRSLPFILFPFMVYIFFKCLHISFRKKIA